MDIPRNSGKQIVTNIHKDLQKERANRIFDSEELTNLLDGGKHITRRRRELLNEVFQKEVFQSKQKLGLSHEEKYVLAIKKVIQLFKMATEKGWAIQDDLPKVLGALHYDIPIVVHMVMFIPVIERMGTDAQKAKWLPQALTFGIIGTYAQTELGHGTNLRALETTATYDMETQEFVLNTPLPSGMKWWPGGLGKSSNFAVVMAKLLIRNEDYGMQAFMVQLRDLKTHVPLPNVEVGSIGNRIGLVTADNGYLILKNVRIPRENMLMKYSKVTADGKFLGGATSKENYGTMILVRANIVAHAYQQLAQGVTIAVRFSAVRRQSELKPGAPEPQILDYQTQQHKLLPNLALSFALFYAKHYMLDTYHTIYEQELSKGKFDSVGELHSQSAGLKAFATDGATEGIEICRRACGGHGYLESSGIATLYLDSLASVTYEGENTVMYLQTARYLVKSFTRAVSGSPVTWSVQYLSSEPPAPNFSTSHDCLQLQLLKNACFRRAYFMVEKVAHKLQSLVDQGQPQYTAWNNCSVELVHAAKAHLDSFVMVNFIDSFDATQCSAELRDVLKELCQLHVYSRMLISAAEFLQSGALTFENILLIQDLYLQLLGKLRCQAVALVDAFDWHDETLGSALGSYDGNVYENLYKLAKDAKLNKEQVHPVIKEVVKPFQEMSKL